MRPSPEVSRSVSQNICGLADRNANSSWTPIIWWSWLSDDDYTAKQRGGFFLECQLAKKQAWHLSTFKRPMKFWTVREYRKDLEVVRSARRVYAKRNKPRTDPHVAAYRFDAGMRALSSSDESESGDR